MHLKKKQKKKSIKCAYTYWFEYKNFYDVIATLGMYHQVSSFWRIRQPFIPTLTVWLRFSIFHFYGWVFLPLHLIIWTIVNNTSKIIMVCKIIYFIWVCCLVVVDIVIDAVYRLISYWKVSIPYWDDITCQWRTNTCHTVRCWLKSRLKCL